MKYALYGISCCGKDTLIENLLASGKFPGFIHPEGSKCLNTMAQHVFGKNFKEISAQEKDAIRIEYAQKLSKEKNLFADGHYCFPTENGYEVVFTEADGQCYDSFLYLRAKPELVKERLNQSEKNKRLAHLTTAQIDNWQEQEISELRDICFTLNKDFIVLDADFDSVLKFLEWYDTNHEIVNGYRQASRLAELCRIHAQCNTSSAGTNKIALFDCDRTIIAEDSGALYFKENGEDLTPVRELFDGDIYSMYQFEKYGELSKFPRFPATSNYHMNTVVMEKIAELRKGGYLIVGITSGIGEIWRDYNREKNFADWIIASDRNLGFTICDFTKGFLAKILAQDNHVVACGDSLADIYMLEAAAQGILYAPGKIRSSVQEYLDRHPDTSIKQFAANPIQYNNIEAV